MFYHFNNFCSVSALNYLLPPPLFFSNEGLLFSFFPGLIIWKINSIIHYRDFPGGPVAKTALLGLICGQVTRSHLA